MARSLHHRVSRRMMRAGERWGPVHATRWLIGLTLRARLPGMGRSTAPDGSRRADRRRPGGHGDRRNSRSSGPVLLEEGGPDRVEESAVRRSAPACRVDRHGWPCVSSDGRGPRTSLLLVAGSRGKQPADRGRRQTNQHHSLEKAKHSPNSTEQSEPLGRWWWVVPAPMHWCVVLEADSYEVRCRRRTTMNPTRMTPAIIGNART